MLGRAKMSANHIFMLSLWHSLSSWNDSPARAAHQALHTSAALALHQAPLLYIFQFAEKFMLGQVLRKS